MLTKTEKTFSLLFLIILIIELICGGIESLNTLHHITKPSIVISLLLFFWILSDTLFRPLRILTMFALSFSLIGDMLLLFVEKNPVFFIFGLVSFLITHIIYSLIFLKQFNRLKNQFWPIILLVSYAIGFFMFLKDYLGDMLIPVLFYFIAILIMTLSAFWRKGKTNSLSYAFVIIGAILFMISDSILALNKFYKIIPFSNLNIMLTYGLAQYFIVLGLLKHR